MAEGPFIPGGAVFLVIGLGVADFLSAFFFGFFSSETPLQLFRPAVANNVLMFPTGMIPLFLVPYAIFFHTLSALNHVRFGKVVAKDPSQGQRPEPEVQGQSSPSLSSERPGGCERQYIGSQGEAVLQWVRPLQPCVLRLTRGR